MLAALKAAPTATDVAAEGWPCQPGPTLPQCWGLCPAAPSVCFKHGQA